MGNCQAVDAAALVIQHPNGKLDRLYWPTPASEVMKTNPGHYVTVIIPLPLPAAATTISSQEDMNNTIKKNNTVVIGDGEKKTIRFTKVKLLRPTDMLVLGRAYRLVTTQEVMEVLRAKKIAKMKKKEMDSRADHEQTESKTERRSTFGDRDVSRRTDTEKNNQESKEEKGRSVGRTRSWRPSLQSISESIT